MAGPSNLLFLTTLNTLQQFATQPRTSREIRTRPVSCFLQLYNSQSPIFNEFRGAFIHLAPMMVIHGGLVLVCGVDMQLLVFVQEVEQLIADDTLVSMLVGVVY